MEHQLCEAHYLGVLHLFVPIIFTTIISGWGSYQPHFTSEETEARGEPANRWWRWNLNRSSLPPESMLPIHSAAWAGHHGATCGPSEPTKCLLLGASESTMRRDKKVLCPSIALGLVCRARDWMLWKSCLANSVTVDTCLQKKRVARNLRRFFLRFKLVFGSIGCP